MKISRAARRASVVIASVAMALPLALATPASAAVDPSAPVWYEVDVTGVSRTAGVVRYDQELGRCTGSAGVTCAVKIERSATRTIGTSFGLSVAGVAATLGISSASSVSIGSTCSGKPQPPSHRWVVGYAEGTVYRYTVRQRTYEYGRLVRTSTSVQTAFNPLGVHCALAS